MGFKKLRGVKLPEEVQGLIRYTCLTYGSQPGWIQEKIERLCIRCGGDYSAALKEVMCTHKSITQICIAHHVSESLIYQKRKKFYESWNYKSDFDHLEEA